MEFLSRPIVIVFAIFVIIIFILWTLLPFAVFGIKERLDKLIASNQIIAANTAKIIAQGNADLAVEDSPEEEETFPSVIEGEARKYISSKCGIKFQPLSGSFRYKRKGYSSFESAAYAAFQDGRIQKTDSQTPTS